MQGYNVLMIYAGEGNIGHMIEQVNMVKEKILSDNLSLSGE
ncbi:hypothetical protein SAMN05421736_104244 [Evansella caseinilytica]|uniref:Uncharacterized protein n=1 Tax=Evansella caseinilytica TaxID=1503961 RepID=A0A1H3NX70_9BACI|nr:hypothetical protein [Evansella caseinilytica]SDY93474.1 hypothetical protein SAMN05421736_104244 [Evansella caseinilytica]